ncbi:hypothetical protein PR003_g21145 [Phytophthora rubi]|uniref:Uncharacterized protein n=1 Tax=Phytophthora rubi TaxID=129364 RepID=A0A6A4DQI1_9STRA|nr:hypothetical protein PR003_g21145 [Phytophthora rubi]
MQQQQLDGPGPGPPDPGIDLDDAMGAKSSLQNPPQGNGDTRSDNKLHQREQAAISKGREAGTDAEGILTDETNTDEDAETTGARSLGGSKNVTWSDKVRTPATHTEVITEVMAKSSHMLEDVWNPVHKKLLLCTLMTDWEAAAKTPWTTEEATMRQEAMMSANVSCDESVRAWTQRENEILLAYLRGRLDLPHPPNFIKEILIGEHRAMIEDMHEAYLNATLTAVVPATVRLTRNAAHAVIFRELFNANTDKNTGRTMMSAFQRDVKRLSFDGNQTLSVIFYSRTAAARWQEKALRLQKAVIVFRDTVRQGGEEGSGQYTPAQVEIQYAVRVYGGESMGLATLARIFAQVSAAKVLDVEYAREQRADIYDNRYHTIRFAQTDCPSPLKGVSKIKIGDQDILIHHFQHNLRKPYSRCLNQKHGTMKCTAAFSKLTRMQEKATRILDGPVEHTRVAPRREYQVASIDELVTLLQSNIPQQLQAANLIPGTQEKQQHGQEGDDSKLTTVADNVTMQLPEQEGDSSNDMAADAAGYTVKESKKSKSAKTKARKAKSEAGQQRTVAKMDGAGAEKQQGRLKNDDADGREGVAHEKSKGAHTGRKKTHTASGGSNKMMKRFEKFQRAEALGRYGALADSDSEEEKSDSMEVDEENMGRDDEEIGEEDNDAPYAYPPIVTQIEHPEHHDEGIQTADSTPTRRTPEEATASPNHQQQDDATLPTPMEGIMTDVVQSMPSTRSSTSARAAGATSKVIRRQRHHNAGIGLPDGAIKGMQTSMANFMHQVAAAAVTTTECEVENDATGTNNRDEERKTDTVVPETPDSQEEFTMGETRVGTAEGDSDLPIQLGQWLSSFQGQEVTVAANGQCAFLAILASTINHKGPEMKITPDVEKDATDTKWYVYTLMMANLRKDVELRLVDPIEDKKTIGRTDCACIFLGGTTRAESFESILTGADSCFRRQ